MSSSIGPAVQALASKLEAAALDNTSDLYGVQIAFAQPDQVEEQEVIGIMGIVEPDEVAWVIYEKAPRDETYGIAIGVKVYDPAETEPKLVWDRGWTLAQAVRQVLVDNVTLDDTVFQQFPGAQRSQLGVTRPLGEDGKRLTGWVIRIDMVTNCRAFI